MTKFSFPVKDSQFKKASGSAKLQKGGGGGDVCILVANTKDGVALRDSKDPRKKTLFFNHLEFEVFKTGVNAGEFD